MPTNQRALRRKAGSPGGLLGITGNLAEYVLDYLAHSFPTQLHETYTDDNGNLLSRPVFVDGQPVHSQGGRGAARPADRASGRAASGAGRARPDHPSLRHGSCRRSHRPRTAHRAQAASGAVSFSPSRTARPRPTSPRRRPSWTARRTFSSSRTPAARGAAIMPISPRATSASASTICWRRDGRPTPPSRASAAPTAPTRSSRRSSARSRPTCAARSAFSPPSPGASTSLGAITRGQRQTGGQGLFRAEDNLESPYARAALRRLYALLHRGQADCCSLERFQKATGLNLLDGDGTLREELPPITTFLNRMLALEIDLQNAIFATFEELLAAQIESAIAAGTYEVGLETIRAESLVVTERRADRHARAPAPRPGFIEVARKDRNQPLTLAEALELAQDARRRSCSPTASPDAPPCGCRAPSLTLEDGTIERRVRLVRPMERPSIADRGARRARTGARPTRGRSPSCGRASLRPCRNSRRAGFMW